jgi:hypothetical protein
MTIDMPKLRAKRTAIACLLAAGWLGASSPELLAHGGVMIEEDICVIKMGFLSAHFTIYQPETRASQEFCEDIPDVAQTVFVMDYLHESLKEMPLEFRIIRDVTDNGIYARSEDVAAIEDLESATVFYSPPRVRRDAAFTVEHRFEEPGWYIGIVTTRHPATGKVYETVFPFHVGRTYGYLPAFVLLGLGIQIAYLVYNGSAARLWAKLARQRG